MTRLREAIKPHREFPVDIRRSKCGARVCKANIEHLETERHVTIRRKEPNNVTYKY